MFGDHDDGCMLEGIDGECQLIWLFDHLPQRHISSKIALMDMFGALLGYLPFETGLLINLPPALPK